MIDLIELHSILRDRLFTKAIELFQKGTSVREISRTLNIPRSTLKGKLRKEVISFNYSNPSIMTRLVGTAPYGYCMISGKLVDHPKEKETLHKIWELWRGGKNTKAISEILNHLRIRPRRSLRWNQGVIRCIVKRGPEPKSL